MFDRGTASRLLVVGLGNPGKEYELTRHNVGFMVIDSLAQKLNLKLDRLVYNSLMKDIYLEDGRQLILMKPLTYMNLSGQAVAPAVKALKLNPQEELLVIHDDLDLPLGTVRFKPRGGTGGHRGLKSIINSLKTDTFPRLRIGILGSEYRASIRERDFVLEKFSHHELEIVKHVIDIASEAILYTIREGLQRAMTRYNSSSKKTDGRGR